MEKPYYYPIIESVKNQTQKGQIFKFGNSNFILHNSGFSAIESYDKKNIDKLVNLILEEEKIPQYFHIYDADISLVSTISNDNRFGFKLRKRLRFKIKNPPSQVNSSLTILHVSKVPINSLINFDLDIENRFWTSGKDFVDYSMGKVLFENNNPASICYACAVSDNFAEIDVYTLPYYRGKGYAKVVSNHFVIDSLQHNITPFWDCFEDNIGSVKVAKELGFQHIHTYDFLSVFNKLK